MRGGLRRGVSFVVQVGASGMQKLSKAYQVRGLLGKR